MLISLLITLYLVRNFAIEPPLLRSEHLKRFRVLHLRRSCPTHFQG
jgi:hypothetical protein